ncbi:SufS family cysteine desulfurase [archaeon]|nr:SufS family cysteine desulfurase [archaeon]
MNKLNSQKIKSDFPILNQKINRHDLVYLDNGATTQKPNAVINAISNYYSHDNSNTHRSVHELASRATIQYEHARTITAKFIGAKTEEIIFTSGTTDSLNKLVNSLKHQLKKGDEIVLTEMEHHSNIVPWQQVAKETGAVIKWIPITDDFRLDLTTISKLITTKTKILSLTHVSNVLGTINPVKEIIKEAKSINQNVIAIVDAAQSVPHISVNVTDLGCDFLAFSAHKAVGPMGVGVLFGKSQLLVNLEPNHTGGGMVLEVTKDNTTFNQAPYKFEAGTPNVAGAVGLAAALTYLSKLTMNAIEQQMHDLTVYGLEQLNTVHGLNIIGSKDAKNRAPVFSFTIKGMHPHDIGEILNSHGVAIRGGHHCAMPLFKRLKLNGASRASAYIYNSKEDIDQLIVAIKAAQKIFGVDK